MGAYLAFHLSATDGGVLTPEQLEALHRPPPGTTYAMGWSARTLGQPVLLHQRLHPAFTATMVLATEPGLSGGDDQHQRLPAAVRRAVPRRIAADAMRLLLGEQVAAPSPWATWGELAIKVACSRACSPCWPCSSSDGCPAGSRRRAPALVLRGAALDVAMLGGLLLGVPAVFGIPLGACSSSSPTSAGWSSGQRRSPPCASGARLARASRLLVRSAP